MTQGELPTPPVIVNPETKRYWDGAAEGILFLPKCEDCGHIVWYPRSICPKCGSRHLAWIEGCGRGTIYSYTVIHRGEGAYKNATPYVVAYVELEEGPRVYTNIVDCDPESVAIGQAVEIVFANADEGGALPRFRPASAATQASRPPRIAQ